MVPRQYVETLGVDRYLGTAGKDLNPSNCLIRPRTRGSPSKEFASGSERQSWVRFGLTGSGEPSIV